MSECLIMRRGGGGSGGSALKYLYKDGTISTEAGDFVKNTTGGNFTKGETMMELSASGSTSATRPVVCSTNAIDLSPYQYLVFDGIRGGGTGINQMGYYSSNDSSQSFDDSANFLTSASTPTIIAIDISAVNESKYIKMFCGVQNANTMKIKRIFLIPKED